MSTKRARKSVARKRSARKKESRHRKSDEEKAFIESLIAHGQAARPGPDGKLPRGATHELTTDASGNVTVVRKRFSAR
jgi:hypothetical protein